MRPLEDVKAIIEQYIENQTVYLLLEKTNSQISMVKVISVEKEGVKVAPRGHPDKEMVIPMDTPVAGLMATLVEFDYR